MKIKTTILLSALFSFFSSIAQPTQFSLASDFTVIRSFKKDQKFWTIGQTVAGHFHFTRKDGMYVWFGYAGKGKFNNQLEAAARDSLTIPQQPGYINKASLDYKHVSVGWRHYLKGTFNAEDKWNLYGYAGFGLLFGSIVNTHTPRIDTAAYNIPVQEGSAHFKRLTLDLGLGFEVPASGDVSIYMEGRALVPTTDYPSPYLFKNNDAPFVGSVNTGIRILFD